MRIYGVMAIAVLLVACGVIHPFGDKTVYQSYSVSDRPGCSGAMTAYAAP